MRQARLKVVDRVTDARIGWTASRLPFERAESHRNLRAKDLEPHSSSGSMVHFGILSVEENALAESSPGKVHTCG